jgi:nucleotide-binding universal stress UspA family protein
MATKLMRVLVITDGSEYSNKAVKEFILLTHGDRHDVTALYLIPLTPNIEDEAFYQIEQEREGTAALDTVHKLFRDIGQSIHAELREGFTSDAVLDFIRSGRYDLVVTGNPGTEHSPVLAGIAQHLAKHSPCSVFIAK